MWLKNIKTLELIRIVWAAASFFNLCFLSLYFYDILLPDGAYGIDQILQIKTNSIPSLLPRWTLEIIPYWNSGPPWVSLLLHTFSLVLYIGLKDKKIWGMLLCAFEYVLLTRIAYVGHGGQILLIFLLFFDSLTYWFPQKRKVSLNLIPVYFLFFVYFISGYSKDYTLWFENGDALQKFIRLEFNSLGKEPWELGALGTLFTRLVYLVELVCPLVILFDFFSQRVPRKILIVAFLGLSLIHLGSLVVFSLFTFPLLGLSFLAYWYSGHQNYRAMYLREKLFTFLLIASWQLIQVARLPVPPLVFPILHRWTFFSKPAKALAGQLEFKLFKGEEIVHQTTFTESFHWTRFRFMLDETAPFHEKFRISYAKFMCNKFKADSFHWKSPKSNNESPCSNLKNLERGSAPAQ